jgi:hypothetical protein
MFAARQRFIPGGQRSARSLSAVGTAEISTAQSQFGGASLIVGPGSGGASYCSVAAASQLAFNTGDFTVECWFRTTAKTNSFPTLLSNCPSNSALFNSTSNVWELMDRHNSFNTKLTLFTSSYFFSGTNSPILVSSTSISNNTWYHVAITRSGNTWTMWLDGNSEDTRTSSLTLDNGTTREIGIGKGDSGSQTNYNGHLDEIRFSNVARYSSAFTPNANGPHINDANTVLLVHTDLLQTSKVILDDNT